MTEIRKGSPLQAGCPTLEEQMLKLSSALFVLFVVMSVFVRLFEGGSFTREFWQPTIGVAAISAALIALLFRFIKKHG